MGSSPQTGSHFVEDIQLEDSAVNCKTLGLRSLMADLTQAELRQEARSRVVRTLLDNSG